MEQMARRLDSLPHYQFGLSTCLEHFDTTVCQKGECDRAHEPSVVRSRWGNEESKSTVEEWTEASIACLSLNHALF